MIRDFLFSISGLRPPNSLACSKKKSAQADRSLSLQSYIKSVP